MTVWEFDCGFQRFEDNDFVTFKNTLYFVEDIGNPLGIVTPMTGYG